jgi:uncharacterized protein
MSQRHEVVDGISTMPRQHALLLFFLLAFTISWAIWLPGIFRSVGSESGANRSTTLTLLGSFGPLAAALITTAAIDRQPGFRELGRRLIIWRVKPFWYAFVLLWPALVSLVATGVSMLFGASPPDFGHPPFLDAYPLPPELTGAVPWPAFIPLVFLQQLLIGSAMGEEPGWRGYALPRMQWAHSSLWASLTLGLAWGVWHLPLWLGLEAWPISQVMWEVFRIVGVAVLFTWVFNNTHGSLLLSLLFHASTAVTGLFLASSSVYPAIDVAIVWLTVVLVVALCGADRLVSTRT